jgi:hypothetical protein
MWRAVASAMVEKPQKFACYRARWGLARHMAHRKPEHLNIALTWDYGGGGLDAQLRGHDHYSTGNDRNVASSMKIDEGSLKSMSHYCGKCTPCRGRAHFPDEVWERIERMDAATERYSDYRRSRQK